MILQTSIQRQSDLKILCEVSDEQNKNINFELKQQIKNTLMTNKNNIMGGFQHWTVQDTSYVQCANMCDNIVYSVVTEKTYPLKLARLYLEDIQVNFIDYLKQQYGTQNVDIYSKIETEEEAYAHIRFDRVIKKKKSEYQDVRSSQNVERLQKEIREIQSIMQDNFNNLMNRDTTISKIGQTANKLKEDSSKFQHKSKKLANQLWYKQNMVYFIIIAVVLLFLLFKIIL